MTRSPTSEFQSSAGVVMIRVPAGSFTMGSPRSEDGHRAWEQQREVTLASDFCLGQSPVTQDQYAAVTGTNPTRHEPAPHPERQLSAQSGRFGSITKATLPSWSVLSEDCQY